MASRRHRRRRQCARKTRYLTEKAAKGAVDAARERGMELHSYYCQFCKAYHIGHHLGYLRNKLRVERRMGW
jgi:hypothetical protein